MYKILGGATLQLYEILYSSFKHNWRRHEWSHT